MKVFYITDVICIECEKTFKSHEDDDICDDCLDAFANETASYCD